MILAIDFDGTIVEHAYPDIGREIPFAIETLKMLQRDGHQLILWTYRTGEKLQEAIDYCEEQGLVFYAENRCYPEEPDEETIARKVLADVYVDDRNLGGLPDWGVIYRRITGRSSGLQAASKPIYYPNAIMRFGAWIEKIRSEAHKH